MAETTVIRDIGETLKQLLRQNIPELQEEDSIVFDSPSSIDAPSNTKLSIFLFQILPNGFLSNIEPEPINLNEFKYPPLLIDLFYLFTLYAQTRETEFLVLEKILQVFFDNAILREQILQGDLSESGNIDIKVMQHSISLEDLNKLWGIFPDKPYKTSLSYIITPVRIPSTKAPRRVRRVIEKETKMYRQKSDSDELNIS